MNTKNTQDTPVEKSDVALREETILSFWKEHDIFNKSLEKDAPNGDFIFYDGPPFATGLPHYGHILAGTIKDAVPRFWTMNGYHVPRKWGWDCHGLPVENLIEKKLGLATKRDIEEYGIQNFNEAARGTVMEFADDWRKIIPRMGRWADMDDDYKTMDSSYTESVWWVFSQLNKKGLVYEGFKSMHLCPRCGTTLSNFEVNQGYKDIKDISVTVKLPLLDDEGNVTDTSLLVWTTTPWTMPGNMAAAVHNEHDYVKVKVSTEEGSEFIVLAKGRLEQLGDVEYEVIETFKGSELVGKKYEPPFDYFSNPEGKGQSLYQNLADFDKAWTIYHADYVELGEEGTGAVHLAPAYGADDMELAQAHGVPLVHHVDETGHFMDFVTEFAGQLVKPKDNDEAGVMHIDADIEIVKALQANGKLFRKENIKHSYPHCWRCDTPLLNYATTSWFVEVTKIKDDLVKENKKVKWVPEHVGNARFGKWLEGARDWAVSRQRYWGAPLPIWRNPETKEVKIFGSFAELQEYVPKSGNTYTIVRHGQAESNVADIISANKDNDDSLTEKGIAQVTTAAEKIEAPVDIIIHSGFERTKQTAEIIAQKFPDAEVLEDDRIRELDIADSFEGKKWKEYNAQFPTWEDRYEMEIAGSENRRDAQKRTGEFMYDLEGRYKGKNIVIVSHAGTLFALESAVKGLTPKQSKEYIDQDIYMQNAEVREVIFTPIPHNDNYELDFHRPYIDNIVLEEDGVQMERVPDVFDCWFESGSMPYGQKHYLGEEVDGFDPEAGKEFPANFIAEGLDQTRGWFYSLIVLGTAIFGKNPYQNVIVNGLILAEDGKKMSKSLQNYPDPMELTDRVGADAIRFYLLSSPVIRAEDLAFSEKEVLELQRKNIGRLNNVLTMYGMFADGSVAAQSDSSHVLDRWIMARLHELIAQSTAGYKNYELDKATRPITDFIDDLSVWYLRRSRDRLKGTDTVDASLALGTLRHVLLELSKVMAPAMPFFAEQLFLGVKAEGDVESVHLEQWPEGGEVDPEVLESMSTARDAVSSMLEARVKAQIKVRQPIAKVTGPKLSSELQQVVLDEVNAKVYEVGDTVLIDTVITSELQSEGDSRDFIRAVQDLRKKSGLEAHDSIVLTVQTDEAGKDVLQQFMDDITATVGATEVRFEDVDGVEVAAGVHTYKVSLQKL
jgi:isoleucyl-tRNA synthetase